MTPPRASRNRYTPGWSGRARRSSRRLAVASPSISVSLMAIHRRIRAAARASSGVLRRSSVGAPAAVHDDQAVHHQTDHHEPDQLAESRAEHPLLGDDHERAQRERAVEEGAEEVAEATPGDAVFAIHAQADIADPEREPDQQHRFKRARRASAAG